jgi:hypothetical protein
MFMKYRFMALSFEVASVQRASGTVKEDLFVLRPMETVLQSFERIRCESEEHSAAFFGDGRLPERLRHFLCRR